VLVLWRDARTRNAALLRDRICAVVTGQSALKRWIQISVGATVVALGVVGYLVFQPPPATVETCLRTKLASPSGSVDDALLLAALQLATRGGRGFTIDSQNSASPESMALSDSSTWNAIARCRALFIPTADALRPPRYAVRVRVLDSQGDQQVPVLGAQVHAKPAGPYCTTDREGACTLTFLDATPQDRIELQAISSSRIEGPAFADTLGALVKGGAVLETAHSYPTLTVSITDCKTHQPLQGIGSVLASPIEGQIWNGVEPTPPAGNGEGRLGQFQDEAKGRVAFLYDDQGPLEVVFVVHVRGRPTQQVHAGRITGTWIQLEYTEDCAREAPPPIVNQVPACTAKTQARMRELSRLPRMAGQQITLRVHSHGLLEALDAPAIVRQRLTSVYLADQPPCLVTLTL
jgi:hypothetical protein